MILPYSKKVIAGVEYYAFKDGLRYIIAQKTISGSTLTFLYKIYNKVDFITAWVLPDLENYTEYTDENITIDLSILFGSGNTGTGGGISLSSTTRTPSRTVISAGATGSIAAGARSMTIELSTDFVGSLLGDNTVIAGGIYNLAVNQNNDVIGAVAWTRTAGSLTVTRLD